MYDNYYGVDSFFNTQTCDRCGSKLTGRTMSWFNTDTICMKCAEEENKLKEKMRKKGMNPSEYEGCGYIPDV